MDVLTALPAATAFMSAPEHLCRSQVGFYPAAIDPQLPSPLLPNAPGAPRPVLDTPCAPPCYGNTAR